VRFGDWKAIKDVMANKIELYNLATDPSEKNDVAAQNPAQIKKAVEYYKTRRTAAVVDWNYGKPDEDR
jgi:arylsulfatase A-like enzyme